MNFLAEKFYALGKKSDQSKIFHIFECLMKVHPIPYAIFETTRSEFPNFASLSSVIKDNFSLFL